ncbi:MAG: BlaI/MecI/CopY family transcriptional regulator [Fibrella sp.]|nr:BlaI/MecI/CopY family transcriptional regulator [Armatimonadota bacterium]
MSSPFSLPEPGTKRPTLGEQETDLLRYVAAQPTPLSVGEAESGWGDPANLSRSTVKTVLDRLHRKGYLERVRRTDGIWGYRSPLPEQELMGSLVQRFVERTLAGSLDPFLAYFARTGAGRLSPTEQRELERLVQKLQPHADESEPPAP